MNWQAIGIVSGVVTGWVTIVITVVVIVMTRREHRITQQNDEIKTEISTAVNHLSDILLAKLETKETVAQISVRLARLEGAAGSSGSNHD